MLTDSTFSRSIRPSPRQIVQGSAITCPAPWQVGPGRSITTKPSCARTLPWPAQVPQVLADEQGLRPVPPNGLQPTAKSPARVASLPERKICLQGTTWQQRLKIDEQ